MRKVYFGGGLAFAHVAGDYSITQTVTIPGVGAATATGASSSGDIVVGGYVRGLVTVPIRRRTELFAGAEFSHLTRFTQSAIGTSGKLDLGKSIFLNAGLRFSF